ncbi:hypothetical protein G7B40_036175 [Aetokthonos hydrillicola Thurmond2011]|jgi:hypothetical protein|uniref:Translation initiation factor IF-2 n=1 Tax=Aetokthonos hydrillicola Thurmond2011 TaxID=2712845 RepID=A0AAP5IGM0_9CYAN|nr:hypothetical protein [Aetokthonos hydrillicola]MBO3457896.1 hypothetical protein [Aetokthonos hydrillicola CCALA 1050]MBW4587383.1 hypothetical protein [Aetokthonos hydrillicola CCALA 1050]MDR9899952.1 hypothetical protein [Aetokthonos hydrillicola Thurmond2011]
MGFADLSIGEIAADYSIPVDKVLSICDQLKIAYKNQKTRLALEDAKAIISEILSEQASTGTNNNVGETEVN